MLRHVKFTGIGELAHCGQTLMCERGVVGVGFGSGYCGENRRSHWPSISGLVLVLRIAPSILLLSNFIDLSTKSPQVLGERAYRLIFVVCSTKPRAQLGPCSTLVEPIPRTNLYQNLALDGVFLR